MAIGRDEVEKIGEVIVFDVAVDELFAVAVQDADIHLAGVQINSAVELGGGGVVFHNGSFVVGSRDPGLYVWLCEEVLLTLPRPETYANKNPEGLGGEYQRQWSHSRYAVWSAVAVIAR
jgi:hypothetical protein